MRNFQRLSLLISTTPLLAQPRVHHFNNRIYFHHHQDLQIFLQLPQLQYFDNHFIPKLRIYNNLIVNEVMMDIIAITIVALIQIRMTKETEMSTAIMVSHFKNMNDH